MLEDATGRSELPNLREALRGSPAWRRLLTHFDLHDGAAFLVLLAPGADAAEAARHSLQRYLHAHDRTLHVLRPGVTSSTEQLPSDLLELQPEPTVGAIWVAVGFPPVDAENDWATQWRAVAARLNESRNSMLRRFRVPIVMAGPSALQPVLRDAAPDLWSTRTLVVSLPVPPSLPRDAAVGIEVPVPTDGKSLDPEYALEQARRAQQQDAEAVHVARLLVRAAGGFFSRNEWEQAVAIAEEALGLLQEEANVAPIKAEAFYILGKALREQTDYEWAKQALEQALVLYRRVEDIRGEANCIFSAGDIALERSDDDAARRRYEEALPLYQQLGDLIGEANCIYSLGRSALYRSDYSLAQLRHSKALALYRQVGDLIGEANCIQGLGDIALARSDDGAARKRYEEALSLYRQVGELSGEAYCIFSLGEIAWERSDHEAARKQYEEALTLFRQTGHLLGEANCIHGLGEIARNRSEHDAAKQRYEEALPLYRQVGDLQGEANSIIGLGDVALARSDYGAARGCYEEALALYEQICAPYSIGRARERLARLAEHEDERREHVAAAREAWASIDRPDLLSHLDEEFGELSRSTD